MGSDKHRIALDAGDIEAISVILNEMMPLIETIIGNYDDNFIETNIQLHESIADLEESFDDQRIKDLINKWEENF